MAATRDDTQHRADPAGSARKQPAELHETIVENLFDGVYYVDRKRTITYWNPAAERITGRSADEVVGRRCFDNLLGHVDDAGTELCRTACPLLRAMAERRGVEADVYLRHLEGHRVPVQVRCQPIHDTDGSVLGAVEIFSENGAYRDAITQIGELEQLASSDPLTGLYNRRAAELALRARLHDLAEVHWPLGILFVDIDHFKQFNDTFGHRAGADVLRVVGASLVKCLRSADTAARWGGEEFVILTASRNEEQIVATAERLRALLGASSVRAGGSDVHVTVSIGATLARPDDTCDSLVARADRAMYESKRAGRNRTVFAAG